MLLAIPLTRPESKGSAKHFVGEELVKGSFKREW
jgi:hypothetical protein